jgi:hypothetical protein
MGLPECVRIHNDTADLIVATHVGPRVLRYGFLNEANMLGEVPALMTATSLGVWKPWGGHRLWVSPESMPGSYAPDDRRVALTEISGREVALDAPVDSAGIEKRLVVELAPQGSVATLTHHITNRTHWPICVAPWALTIMSPGGYAAMPQPVARSHEDDLQPAMALVVWSFTDLTDPRWSIGRRLIRLTPDSGRPSPQKIGVGNRQGWCAFVRGTDVFVKRFNYDSTAEYPDYGCNNELYVAGEFMEIETLGPLRLLDPGHTAIHTERWTLARRVELGETEDAAADALAGLSRTIPL